MKKTLPLLAALLFMTGCSTLREYVPLQSAQQKADAYDKYESYTEAKLELIKRRKQYWEEQAQAEAKEGEVK